MGIKERIKEHLDIIYNKSYDSGLTERISCMAEACRVSTSGIRKVKWDESDVILITYGNSIVNNNENSLKTLHQFLLKNLDSEVSIVHILPFFPYSSDDGFSVIDFKQVNPELGSWDDIGTIGTDFSLMFDLVINHISQYSEWFQNYLENKSPGKDFFIEVKPSADISKVVRPRSLPLLTKFETSGGEKNIWTTFSADQIDLNFRNPAVLEEILSIFLLYITKGAKIIRLDAIAFLWKEIGTSCLHLLPTHEVVKLMRTLTDFIHPGLIILTETNVPHKENISYMGNGDEAHMVYQFSLPPLLLNTLFRGNSYYLTQWAKSLTAIPPGCTFFNFTASHDGIGFRPLEGLLPEAEIDRLVKGMKNSGGLISTRRNPDGTESIYEVNITYFDALRATFQGVDNFQAERFICSQTIMMSMKGIPAFYIHSLMATPNYHQGVKETGMNRSINRRKWNFTEIESLLSQQNNHSKIHNELKRLIGIRKGQKAFHPDSEMEIHNSGPELFVVSRGNRQLVSISNVTDKEVTNSLYQDILGSLTWVDLIKGNTYTGRTEFKLSPYQTVWLVVS